jgi:protein-S-isoprenylcysteine O-methyltransferase Ste14
MPWRLLLFRVIIGGIVAGASPYSIATSRGPIVALHAGLAMAVGVALCGLGLFIYFRSVWDFIDFAPTAVVASGTYRVIRNPMYAGLVLMLAGESALTALPVMAAYTATIAVVLHLLVLLYEEPALARRFGPAYEAYRADVNRWLPGLGR